MEGGDFEEEEWRLFLGGFGGNERKTSWSNGLWF